MENLKNKKVCIDADYFLTNDEALKKISEMKVVCLDD